MTSKVLTFQFYQPNEEIQSQTSAYKREINFEIIKACKIYTQSLADIGLHAYYQCLLLYGEVLERPYKPQTFLNFSQTISILEKIFIDHQLDFKIRNQIHQIMHSIFLFLCKLTSIDGQNLFTTESRRLAIISLIVPNDKQFPFKAIKSSDLLRFIPKELISLLEQFFNYPIVEKPIVLLQKNETKSSSKPKITIFSKSLFNIISEHEPVSKARYKYIGGQWVSGDIQKSTYTPFRKRNYIEEIQKTLLKKSTADYQPYHSTHRSMRKQQLIFNQLFYLTLNKSKQDVPKKQVDKTIQLKDVIPRSTPQEIRREPPPPPVPINPSPSRTLGGADKRMPGYNNMTGREGISRSPIPPDRQYNRNSNPRSSSQNNNAAHYSSPPKYYDPRANMVQPPRSVQPSVPSQGYHSSHMHQQGQHNYYNPNQQQSYDNRYYNPHPPHSGHHNQRYIPPSNYGPPPAQVYMNPTQPMIRSVPPPATGIYPHHNIAGMYGQSMNHLNQYEEQLLNEAFSLLNQIKTSGLSESDMSVKKSRLNFILSNHPKVHQRLKEILPQKS